MSEKQTEEVKPILVMGGNVSQEQLDEFRKQWLEYCQKPMQVLQLEPVEIIEIISNRKKVAENETVAQFLANEQEQNNAHGFAEKLITEMVKNNKRYEESDTYPHKKMWKNLTNLSWGRFDTVIRTLDLFGHIEWLSAREPNHFRIVIQKEKLDENQLQAVETKIEELKTQIDLARTSISDSELKKKLYNFKRKLSLNL